MSEPRPISDFLPEVMEKMKSIYLKAKKRGFNEPRPYDSTKAQKRFDKNPNGIEDVRAALERRNWTQPTTEFLEWWKGHRNCNVNPVVAWNCQSYRDEFEQEKYGYGAA